MRCPPILTLSHPHTHTCAHAHAHCCGVQLLSDLSVDQLVDSFRRDALGADSGNELQRRVAQWKPEWVPDAIFAAFLFVVGASRCICPHTHALCIAKEGGVGWGWGGGGNRGWWEGRQRWRPNNAHAPLPLLQPAVTACELGSGWKRR